MIKVIRRLLLLLAFSSFIYTIISNDINYLFYCSLLLTCNIIIGECINNNRKMKRRKLSEQLGDVINEYRKIKNDCIKEQFNAPSN